MDGTAQYKEGGRLPTRTAEKRPPMAQRRGSAFVFVGQLVLERVQLGAATADESKWLMVAYAVGVMGIFGTLWLLHWRAWRKRGDLELTEVEQALTRGTMSEHAISVVIATLSLSIALAGSPSFAGLIYFLMPVCQGLNGWRNGLKVDRLVNQGTSPNDPAPSEPWGS